MLAEVSYPRRFMASRDAAVNLRLISSSAVAASPAARARRLACSFACLASRPSVTRVRTLAPPPDWCHSCIRVSVPGHRSSAPQPHPGCDLPVPSPTACRVRNRASQVALGGLCCHSVCGPPELPERVASANPVTIILYFTFLNIS